jgi:hypothetical protein
MVRSIVRSAVLLLVLSAPALAGDFDIYLGNAKSETNRHGQSRFRLISFELIGKPKFPAIVERYLPGVHAGVDVDYADVRQPRSWFGYTYGDPDDSVRAEWAHFFLRKYWRTSTALQPYADLGTGPMWSNRRIPAATSKINFSSQLGLGVALFANSRTPIFAGYRFFHISNGGATGRNPGLNVNGFFVGTRISRR